MKEKFIITSLSSTGTGKTTLMVHLAYLLAQGGLSVALIELDNRRSLHDCWGLPKPTAEFSTASILTDDFDGNYPFFPLWSDTLKNKAVVCQAERNSLESVSRQLTGDPFGMFRLRECLDRFSLSHDVVLIDAPGQQGQLSLMALCAATHLIICAEMTQKCISDINALFEWLYKYKTYLKSTPEILGILPSRYDHNAAIQRNTLNQFPAFAQKFNTLCFSPIRQSSRFFNAYAMGLPIFLDSPGSTPCYDFTENGHLFKKMNQSKLKGLDGKMLQKLPAIAPYIINEIKK